MADWCEAAAADLKQYTVIHQRNLAALSALASRLTPYLATVVLYVAETTVKLYIDFLASREQR